MWIDLENINFFEKDYKFFIYLGIGGVTLLYTHSVELVNFEKLSIFKNFFINFYSCLLEDNYEELDGLGFLLAYLNIFFLLILVYFLLFLCCCCITLVNNSKKFRLLQPEILNLEDFQLNNKIFIKFQKYTLQDSEFFSTKLSWMTEPKKNTSYFKRV